MGSLPRGKEFRPRDAVLAVELLRRSHPEALSRLVLVGIIAALLGYSVSALGIYFEHSLGELTRRADLWALGSSVLALGFYLRGRVRAAGALVLGPVWLEEHVTLATMPQELWAAPGLILPLLVLLAGVWLGARAAGWMGAVTIFTAPAVVLGAGELGLGSGLAGPEAGALLLTITLANGVTLLILTFLLGTLGRLLRQSEADRRRAKDLLDDTPDAIVALDAEERVQEANPAAALLFGVQLKDLLGTPVRELPLAPAQATWDEALDQLREGERAVEFTTRGNRLLEAVARRRARRDGSERALLVLRDITARRETEQRSQDLWLQLQQAQKLEAVGMLAGSVAHDFNNLLTAVSGYGSLLHESTDPEARSYGSELLSMQERGKALVRQLLSYARRDPVAPRPIDLAALLGAVTPLMQRVVGERVRLFIDVTQRCLVVADPGQLEQVLLNLLANARDAMPEGGEIHVSCERVGEQVVVEVRDTGEGIPESVRAHIFEPFFTTKERGKGTGLGLSTAATIVRDSGGTIEVTSVAGQGTTFVMALPATDQSPGEVEPRPSRIDPPLLGANRHVFVVEDNDALRGSLQLMLERAGFRVTLCGSGDEASSALKALARPPDVLLTDVVLPGRTGPQLAADARVRFPDLPVLFMTGYAGEAGNHIDFTMEDTLQKPFTDRELLGRIHDKLARRRGAAVG